jgi:modulator of FtsH protease HflC
MKVSFWAPIAAAALLLLFGSVFTVNEGHTAIVLNLGKVVRTDLGPGLHFKIPLIESNRTFDQRLLVLPAEPALPHL